MRVKVKAAQHNVHLMCGNLRLFLAFFPELSVQDGLALRFSCFQALSTPPLCR